MSVNSAEQPESPATSDAEQAPLSDAQVDVAIPRQRAARDYPYATKLALGVTAGATTGLGLALRKHYESGWGFQFSGIPYIGNDVFWTAGAEVYYTFLRLKRLRLYGLFGAAGWGSYHDTYRYPTQDVIVKGQQTEPKSVRGRRDLLMVGPGVGVEFHFGQHVGLSIELPVSLWVELRDTADESELPLGGRFNLLPVPNGSLSVYF